MAFSTPATSVAGTALTAAYLNTYVRDNIAWLATDSPACRAYNSAAISIPDSVFTAATYNSERFDNAAVHSTSSNTGRLTVPTGGAGKYLVGAVGQFGALLGNMATEFRINGSTIIAYVQQYASASTTQGQAPLSPYALSAADYVECLYFQSSGAPLNLLSASAYTPEFFCFWFRT